MNTNPHHLLAFSLTLLVGFLAAPAAADDEASSANSDATTEIHLIAGKLDEGHPAEAHRYAKDVRLLTKWLNKAENLQNVKATAHFDGWPSDPAALDEADTVVLISSGADRKRTQHPLLRGDRLDKLAKHMDRGCGLVVVHWATFVPNGKPGDRFLDWVGGYFDYQSGKDHPRNWYSRIKFAMAPIHLGTPDHPISRGVEPYVLRDEYYYRMRLREQAPKPDPILVAQIAGVDEPQTVGWALQRPDGGRGFAYSGGHFHKSWLNDDYRTVILNAIAWTAGAEVPEGGVASSVIESELSTSGK